MSLNIKDEHVHDLAREAARRTGRSQTRAIETALLLLLRQFDDADDVRRARVIELIDDFHRRLEASDPALLSTDGLYDDAGLPS